MIKILFIKNKGGKIKEVIFNIYEFRKRNIFNINNSQIISRKRLFKNYTFVNYLKARIEIGLTVKKILLAQMEIQMLCPYFILFIEINQVNMKE
jgi:hypothetical protein